MEILAKIGMGEKQEYIVLSSGAIVTQNSKEGIGIKVMEKPKGILSVHVYFKLSEHMPKGAIKMFEFKDWIQLDIFNADNKKIVNEAPIFVGYIDEDEIYLDLVVELIAGKRRKVDYIFYKGITHEKENK